MKKTTAFLLAVVLLLCLAACGTGSREPTGQVADIFEAGYTVSMTRSGDKEIGVLLEDSENISHIAITASLSAMQMNEFEALDIMDASYESDMKAFLCGLDSVTIEELDDLVPTEEELDAYVGKTIGDIQAEGFDQWGYVWGEGEYTLIYDNCSVVMSFTVADANGIEDPDAASAEQLGALVISEAAFYDISDCYFDRGE